jgi:hypothetical protein
METGIPLVFVGIARLHDYRLSLRAALGLKAKNDRSDASVDT